MAESFVVGSTADIRRLAGPQTRTIDLAGRSVVPGFIDSDGDNALAGASRGPLR